MLSSNAPSGHAPTQARHIVQVSRRLRRECLDHMLIVGERHLHKVLAEFARHYNEHRPHQSLRQEAPQRTGSAADITARIERWQVLSGLINEYRRAA